MQTTAYLDRTPHPVTGQRRIVIVGGGFGGLACAKALSGADADVRLVDRRNHHLFQPLLYQVSTAATKGTRSRMKPWLMRDGERDMSIGRWLEDPALEGRAFSLHTNGIRGSFVR